tara:strand:- start:245 stop:406 length:162 start_codon:yes stop_codon:yes gene_type:complete
MNKKGELRDSNIIVDMNDIKGVFGEWMMKKMDEDLEKMLVQYLTDKIVKDSKN